MADSKTDNGPHRMTSDDKFWLFVCAILGALLVTITVSIAYVLVKRVEIYVTNNYCESVVPGSSMTIWSKCPPLIK